MSEDYSQPDFYRFNEDSTRLVRWILGSVQGVENILDLGAGCGIIGMELARNLGAKSLTLVELQVEYLPHLQKNRDAFLPPEIIVNFQMKSLGEFKDQARFDLIVTNPPYYLPGKGELPRNLNKARARTFLVDDWAVLMQKIQEHLSPDGRAFVVLKKDVLDHIKGELKNFSFLLHPSDHLVILELFTLNKN